MQTIENSLLQVSVDENGAQMVNCVSQNDKFDYLKSQDGQEKVAVAFPAIDQEKNWALELPWTVVDKGDSRVSLTLIDTEESYTLTLPFGPRVRVLPFQIGLHAAPARRSKVTHWGR